MCSAKPGEPDVLALSLLNDFLFCPRRAALKAVDGCWGQNAHTVKGDLAHEHGETGFGFVDSFLEAVDPGIGWLDLFGIAELARGGRRLSSGGG